jgi:lipid A 3-O-deacylase
MNWLRCASIVALSLPSLAVAADAPVAALAPTVNPPVPLYDPTRFEIRGGGFASSWGPEAGTPDINGELVFPKIYSVQGWQDFFIPRLHVGGMGNLDGRTSYGYAGALWTFNYDRYFAEASFGGAVHNGPLIANGPDQPSLGCRVLYHTSGDLGYRFDQHWSAMVTFDHASNGSPTLSNCRANTGISVIGLRVGYSF